MAQHGAALPDTRTLPRGSIMTAAFCNHLDALTSALVAAHAARSADCSGEHAEAERWRRAAGERWSRAATLYDEMRPRVERDAP